MERVRAVDNKIRRCNTRLTQVQMHKSLAFAKTSVSQPVEFNRLVAMEYKVHQDVANHVFEKLLSNHPHMFKACALETAPPVVLGRTSPPASPNHATVPGQVSTGTLATSSVSTGLTSPTSTTGSRVLHTQPTSDNDVDDSKYLECLAHTETDSVDDNGSALKSGSTCKDTSSGHDSVCDVNNRNCVKN